MRWALEFYFETNILLHRFDAATLRTFFVFLFCYFAARVPITTRTDGRRTLACRTAAPAHTYYTAVNNLARACQY
jgi:hypothetical protein